MKTPLAVLAGIVCLACVSYYVGSALGQGSRAAPSALPHKVALIDMAEVFRQYGKFQTLREDLQEKIKAKDEEVQKIVKKMQTLQSKLQGKDLVKGSPDYNDLEKEYVQLGSELEAARKQAQLELMREEAKNYHTVYLEVQAAVKKFADHFHYTIVLRFNREELDSTDPQKVIQGLGRQVVHYNTDDDITDGVVEFLNRGLTGGKEKPTTTQKKPDAAVQPASAVKDKTTGTPKARTGN